MDRFSKSYAQNFPQELDGHKTEFMTSKTSQQGSPLLQLCLLEDSTKYLKENPYNNLT